MQLVQCKKCSKDHDGTFGSGAYCSRSCANSRELTEKQKKAISSSLTKEDTFAIKNCEFCKKEFKAPKRKNSKFCSQDCSNKLKMFDAKRRDSIDTIFKMSSRTRTKLLQRMGKGCSRCGWNEAPCDLHHIHGRKIKDPNSEKNLTLLCPNCHRLFHTGKINEKDVLTLEEYLPDWKDYYYG